MSQSPGLKIALGQFEACPTLAGNLATMRRLALDAARARAGLAVFPEGAMIHLPPGRSLAPEAQPLGGAFVQGLAAIAAEARAAVVAGMFESIPGSDRVFNTVVVLGADGALLGAYRKIHLYDAFGYRESDRIEPGPGDLLTFSLGGLRLGVLTCYDIRFPHLAAELAARGAEAILVPAAWMRGPFKEDHWTVLARARAIENTVYVAGAGQVGGLFVGRSLVVDPMGAVVAGLAEEEGLLLAELHPERVRDVRAVNPSLGNRRPDVYESWSPVAAGSGR